jgi:hypothetical protein
MELVRFEKNLPTTIDDLNKYIAVGKEQQKARLAQIAALEKIGAAENVRDAVLENAQNEADTLLDAEDKFGELMAGIDKSASKLSGKDRGSVGGTTKKTLPTGVTKKEPHYAQN